MILLGVWLSRSLCHCATAAAFTTAQAFHVGSDWRVRVEAETNKIGAGQTSFMPTIPDHYPTSLTQRGHHPYIGPRACGIGWPAINREGAPLVIGYVLGRSRRLVHVEHVRRWLGKVCSAGARRGATALRLHRGFLQSFRVGSQKGRQFAASGIVLAQEAFETENRVRLGYALR